MINRDDDSSTGVGLVRNVGDRMDLSIVVVTGLSRDGFGESNSVGSARVFGFTAGEPIFRRNERLDAALAGDTGFEGVAVDVGKDAAFSGRGRRPRLGRASSGKAASLTASEAVEDRVALRLGSME